MSSSFARLATVTASTKRNPAVGADGKRGAPVTQIASLTCTPLDPVDPELKARMQLDTPHELLTTYVDGDLDIRQGDYLVVSSREYPIRSVADWEWRGSVYLVLVLEDLKR